MQHVSLSELGRQLTIKGRSYKLWECRPNMWYDNTYCLTYEFYNGKRTRFGTTYFTTDGTGLTLGEAVNELLEEWGE